MMWKAIPIPPSRIPQYLHSLHGLLSEEEEKELLEALKPFTEPTHPYGFYKGRKNLYCLCYFSGLAISPRYNFQPRLRGAVRRAFKMVKI